MLYPPDRRNTKAIGIVTMGFQPPQIGAIHPRDAALMPGEISVCSTDYNLINSLSRKAAVNPIELIVLLVDFAREIFVLGRQELRRHGIGGARIVDDGHSRDSFQQREFVNVRGPDRADGREALVQKGIGRDR